MELDYDSIISNMIFSFENLLDIHFYNYKLRLLRQLVLVNANNEKIIQTDILAILKNLTAIGNFQENLANLHFSNGNRI